ncbi:TetR/AcrR family transcriptional regulator [Stackebrandtia nassauensis]|uniref:Transcriptional regulator, TetR family n=1 Tax=Stackebrandtia nassauensis (strain DSM 44728 / CIP 108903 / NRRL B-16338 / NBRC 102104 / LLR-40K-21) TaxID=446470 RepID=D3PVB9_STANL|nr:TetR/AcrR family transcriptional regulator C-terminal domain-containing protein [Stackebrandtia nassauensis]ADD41172.1 transcriptional regulator, TetR family [Stackebrandtia nassauensis DSM 44728]
MRCAHCDRPVERGVRGRPRRYCGRSCQARAYRARRDGTARTVARAPGGTGRVVSGRVDREAAVSAAIALADAEGLSAVSMRRLAARLDIAIVTLYRLVSSKDALVSMMMTRVLGQYQPPAAPPPDWRSRLRHEARQEWEMYRRYPWMLPMLATARPPLEGELLAAIDRSMAALYALDVDHRTAMAVYLVVDGFVQGAAQLLITEAESVRDTGMGQRAWWQQQQRRMAAAIDSGRYPWLTALAADDIGQGIDLDEWFAFGLERVLDGVAIWLEPRGVHHPPPLL